MKLDARDVLFSKLVRERAGQRCEACGSTESLQCSHHVSRKYRLLRWHPLNAACHCARCHGLFTDFPVDHGEWIAGHLGAANLATLRAMKRPVGRLKKHDLADILANLKASWQQMQAERAAGVTGRIEFESPYPEVFA